MQLYGKFIDKFVILILFIVKCRNLSEFVTNASEIIIESMTELQNEEQMKQMAAGNHFPKHMHLPIPA